MALEFKNIPKGKNIPDKGCLVAYLKDDNWDDYNFKTLYELTVFDENGIKHEIGGVKIGYFGQESGLRTEIQKTFNGLEKKYFSLGQGSDYYQNINKLTNEIKVEILNKLNDIVNDQELLEKALEEGVTKTSLLRSISILSIKGQFKRLLDGGSLLTDYNFYYNMPQSRSIAGFKLDFSVNPDSPPPQIFMY